MATETVSTIVKAQDAGFSAVFEKAEATVRKTTDAIQKRQETAARGERLLTKALELEAAGEKKLAGALRERIALMEQAARMASKTGMSQSAAMDLVQRQAGARQTLAGQAQPQGKPSGPVGLPMLQLTPEYLKATEKAAMQNKELARQAYAAGRGGKSGAMGFLAFSQAVEDSQYGVKGILNNIPQMVMGFGGSMGLAGAISLAAVAGVALYEAFDKLSGGPLQRQLDAGAKAYRESWKDSLKEIDKEIADREREKRFQFKREKDTQSIKSDLDPETVMNGFRERKLELMARERDLQRQVNDARASYERTVGGNGAAMEVQSRRNEIKGMLEDAAIKEKMVADAVYRAGDVDKLGKSWVDFYKNRIREAEESQKDIQIRMARAKAAAADLEARQKKGSVDGKTFVTLQTAANKLPKLQAELDDTSARIAYLTDMMRKAEDTSKESLATLNKTIRERTDEADALRKQAAALEEVAKLREKEIEAIRQRDALENVRRYGEEQARRAKEFDEEKKQAAERRKREAETRKNRGEFGGEIMADMLRAKGREAMAAALEKEIALRKRAEEVAERTGMHEEHVLRILREQARWLERGESGSNRSNRRQLGFGPSRLEGREGFLHGSPGLLHSEIERRAERARITRATLAKKDPALFYWEKHLDLFEKLAGYVEKLGVI